MCWLLAANTCDLCGVYTNIATAANSLSKASTSKLTTPSTSMDCVASDRGISLQNALNLQKYRENQRRSTDPILSIKCMDNERVDWATVLQLKLSQHAWESFHCQATTSNYSQINGTRSKPTCDKSILQSLCRPLSRPTLNDVISMMHTRDIRSTIFIVLRPCVWAIGCSRPNAWQPALLARHKELLIALVIFGLCDALKEATEGN